MRAQPGEHTLKKPRNKAGEKKTHAVDDGKPRNRVVGGDAPGGLGLQEGERLDKISDRDLDRLQLNREIKAQAGELKGRRKRFV